jgi:hypothetical protein
MAAARRQAMQDGAPAPVESCWMCGIRLPVSHMVADGGGACPDVRWYCRDTHGCTQRWTVRAAPGGAGGHIRAAAGSEDGM